ncbi:hypothetical protein HNQ60_002206 [Povalibacter uvarum]|uniref:Uncharacterized protein n=1 Tax=Povalibacter uvarum TaxID=732238 RepID=A0A841HMB0_9GAMM|nr:hypothetical protein [Povalibacter uvarum]MBB6093328.1 hypothetical protein [Povalibacter uvarum]
MTAPAASQARTSRNIALLKPARDNEDLVEHALQLFDSMLWVFRGTTRSDWTLSPPADADVVVVHQAEASDRVNALRSQGKLIVVLSTQRAAQAADEHTLVYPFPATQVMSLLEQLDEHLDGVRVEKAPTASPAAIATNQNTWSFVDAVRTVRAARNPGIWLSVEDSHGPVLWVRGDGARYQCSAATQAALRLGQLSGSPLVMERIATPRAGLLNGPGDELLWHCAYHASNSYAPWLNESTTYRLRYWPDLGQLRIGDDLTTTSQLRVIAALDALPSSPRMLLKRARVAREHAIRTLNALSACGFIEVVEAAAPTAQRTQFQAAKPQSGFRQLFRNLRRHLQRRSGR